MPVEPRRAAFLPLHPPRQPCGLAGLVAGHGSAERVGVAGWSWRLLERPLAAFLGLLVEKAGRGAIFVGVALDRGRVLSI